MPYENIDAQLSETDFTEIQTLITSLQAKFPFFINLTPAERQKKGSLSRRNDEYAIASYEMALNNAHLLPPIMDMVGWKKDLDLLRQLTIINQQIGQLQEGLSDTIIALRTETAFKTNEALYHFKRSAKSKAPGTDTLVEMLEHLNSINKKKPESTNEKGTKKSKKEDDKSVEDNKL